VILDKRTFKKIEYYLYNADKLKREIEQARKELIEASNPEMAGGINGIGYHSDPTAGKAIKLSTNRITEYGKWIKAVEQVKGKYRDTDKAKFIKLKYDKGLSEKEVCKQLFISRTTFFTWRKEIVLCTGFIALQNGVLKSL
jgi:hypothetical protein